MTSDLRDKRIVITGATAGIGLEAAAQLAAHGASLTLVVRNEARGDQARAQVQKRAPNAPEPHLVYADLGRPSQAQAAARDIVQTHDRLDVLINNAGVYLPRFTETSDGIETTLAVNHLGYHVLTEGVLPLLRSTANEHGEARIVSTASAAHLRAKLDLDDLEMRNRYIGWLQYCNTKMMNILWTRHMAKELTGSDVTANCYHPGYINTRLARNQWWLNPIFRLFGRTVKQGADTMVWLASAPEVEGESGGYYHNRRRIKPRRGARDPERAHALLVETQRIVADRLRVAKA